MRIILLFLTPLITGCGEHNWGELNCRTILKSFSPELRIRELYRCDDFVDGHCLLRQNGDIEYKLTLPGEKGKTWQTLGHHLYFKSRETPGIKIDFNRSMNKMELERLRTTLSCHYRIEKKKRFSNGLLEGRRIDENGDGFWCFDYLGAMLIDYHKKYKSLYERPDVDFFPVILYLEFKSELKGIESQLSSRISVKWTPEN